MVQFMSSKMTLLSCFIVTQFTGIWTFSRVFSAVYIQLPYRSYAFFIANIAAINYIAMLSFIIVSSYLMQLKAGTIIANKVTFVAVVSFSMQGDLVSRYN